MFLGWNMVHVPISVASTPRSLIPVTAGKRSSPCNHYHNLKNPTWSCHSLIACAIHMRFIVCTEACTLHQDRLLCVIKTLFIWKHIKWILCRLEERKHCTLMASNKYSPFACFSVKLTVAKKNNLNFWVWQSMWLTPQKTAMLGDRLLMQPVCHMGRGREFSAL